MVVPREEFVELWVSIQDVSARYLGGWVYVGKCERKPGHVCVCVRVCVCVCAGIHENQRRSEAINLCC